VRHVRMLVLCLVAMFAMSAMTLAVASPALASCNEECQKLKEEEKQKAKEQKEKEKAEAKEQKEKEKAEAKEQKEKEKAEAKVEKEKEKNKLRREKWEETRVGDPYTVETWGQYKYCNYAANELDENCYMGITLGGNSGGFFEFGNVKVPLSKSIVLQGSFTGEGEKVQVAPAVNGGESLDAPELPVVGGIGLFDQKTQEEEEWPAALTESWNEAKKNKETAVNVKIEMAGNECFEEVGCIDSENLLFEEGVAFKLPLKVKITAPWLEKLGSASCYLGSDEHPIHINLTTEGAGASGLFSYSSGPANLGEDELAGSKLVDFGWHIEAASLPEGCGGAYSQYIDASLENALLWSKYRTGVVELKGDLHIGVVGGPHGILKFGTTSGEL
jgi:flagellar motor protein MotB